MSCVDLNDVRKVRQIQESSRERGTLSDSRESPGFSGSPAVSVDFRWLSRGSLWIHNLGVSGFAGHPDSAFLSAVSLASGFTVARHEKRPGAILTTILSNCAPREMSPTLRALATSERVLVR